MYNQVGVQSIWIDKVSKGFKPGRENLEMHLLDIHRFNTGFTEVFSSVCKDRLGRTSYEWLAEVVDEKVHTNILDLACGSGPLLNLCHELYGSKLSLIGVDMSEEELLVAKKRLPKNILLHKGIAQDLDFIKSDSLDVVLCHWALTLMEPIVEVFCEIKRTLKPGGVFSAIVDGDMMISEQYAQISNLIYDWACKNCKNYGSIDLGDSRVRSSKSLYKLVKEHFKSSNVKIESEILELRGTPDFLAKKVSGFYYASYVLSDYNRKLMLEDLESFFISNSNSGISIFKMPINRLTLVV